MYKSRVELLKALADETRLRILDLLRSGECCQCDILPHVYKSQSTVSQHIQILKDCNILEHKKIGQKVEYKVKDKRIFLVLKLVDEMILEHLRRVSETTKGIESMS
ncbi:MAG: winged helix-turn-helix transcriptional regulator [Candidatus Freyarchaeota archaeon]|nr:winged helix-turn-helix transcriptional regulator [Candidatus Jordarchaeia archaeon]MBS7268836.1 winged helix-turn-helix transcriptional regulator [Candidatus Jordarchaeia archaeon]MBS7278219.1 winged helix-turn-helix transcriptional regulator [Candidatus Jordarchaeia archaeon]